MPLLVRGVWAGRDALIYLGESFAKGPNITRLPGPITFEFKSVTARDGAEGEYAILTYPRRSHRDWV